MSQNMNKLKKKRDPTFSMDDKRILIDTVRKYFDKIENNKTDNETIHSKNKYWENQNRDEFNLGTSFPRATAVLKNCWKNLKAEGRRVAADERISGVKTDVVADGSIDTSGGITSGTVSSNAAQSPCSGDLEDKDEDFDNEPEEISLKTSISSEQDTGLSGGTSNTGDSGSSSDSTGQNANISGGTSTDSKETTNGSPGGSAASGTSDTSEASTSDSEASGTGGQDTGTSGASNGESSGSVDESSKGAVSGGTSGAEGSTSGGSDNAASGSTDSTTTGNSKSPSDTESSTGNTGASAAAPGETKGGDNTGITTGNSAADTNGGGSFADDSIAGIIEKMIGSFDAGGGNTSNGGSSDGGIGGTIGNIIGNIGGLGTGDLGGFLNTIIGSLSGTGSTTGNKDGSTGLASDNGVFPHGSTNEALKSVIQSIIRNFVGTDSKGLLTNKDLEGIIMNVFGNSNGGLHGEITGKFSSNGSIDVGTARDLIAVLEKYDLIQFLRAVSQYLGKWQMTVDNTKYGILDIITMPQKQLYGLIQYVILHSHSMIDSIIRKIVGDNFMIDKVLVMGNNTIGCMINSAVDLPKVIGDTAMSCVTSRIKKVIELIKEVVLEIRSGLILLRHIVNSATSCPGSFCLGSAAAASLRRGVSLLISILQTISQIFIFGSTLTVQLPGCFASSMTVTPGLEVAKIFGRFATCMI